jgi:CheY-like chemotaxis protein
MAERANRAKDDFLATLSHELRSPLNSILGWVAIMRMRGGLPAELAQGVDVIERNARAQSQIIADLLDMSSIIAGKLRLEREPVVLDELVRSAVETAMPMARARQIHVEAHVGPEATEFEGDPNRLQQVMWNLLSNAIKFTPPGGRIDVTLATTGDAAEIAVVDTGSGIEPEFLPHVFDRFRQADPSISRRHGGLGLGLSIVRSLVEMHGGSVDVSSEGAGFGTRFAVRLPLCARARRDDDSLAPAAVSRLDGVRALVVDDDPDARTVTQWLLEAAGAAVSVAGSAREGLAALHDTRFDVLVSDIGMPGMDGYDFMRHVRSGMAGAQRDVPAIALTAYARHQDRAMAQQAGFDRHLPKPVDPPVLLDAVAALAQRGEAARA